MQVTLSDLAAVANVAQRVDKSPVGVLGRCAGLGPEEQRAIPWWAWWGAGTLVLAGAAAYLARLR